VSTKNKIPESGIPYIEIINGVKWEFIDLGKMESCTLCELNLGKFIYEQAEGENKG